MWKYLKQRSFDQGTTIHLTGFTIFDRNDASKFVILIFFKGKHWN